MAAKRADDCSYDRDASQDIAQLDLGIDVAELRGLCRAPNYAEVARFPQDSS
jgi:hypothetical protein